MAHGDTRNTNTNICTTMTALTDLLRAERVVGYRPCLAHACGGAQCALLLSQFWFWTGTPTVQGRGGWFWKSQQEITAETGLTRWETETARRKLRALGVLSEERRGIPATVHFRLDPDALCRCLRGHGAPVEKPQPSLRKSHKQECGNPTNKNVEKPQTITENTTDETQKKTQTPERSVLPAAEKKETDGPESPDRRALTAHQCQVNRQGTARLKAALLQAGVQAARRAPPGLGPGGD